jgi:hypothetical protein
MARLTAAGRAALPPSAFAGPGESYPVEDKDHAKAALSLVGRGLADGKLTAAEAAHIRGRARAVLGTAKSHMAPK